MTERAEPINDIEKLKAERNRLLRQVEEAEQWKDLLHGIVLIRWHGTYRAKQRKTTASPRTIGDSSRRDIDHFNLNSVASQICSSKKCWIKKL